MSTLAIDYDQENVECCRTNNPLTFKTSRCVEIKILANLFSFHFPTHKNRRIFMNEFLHEKNEEDENVSLMITSKMLLFDLSGLEICQRKYRVDHDESRGDGGK